ncbi:MAG TPA: DUF58 domain-containing protein [candidate division Zixibacteria bacterium]|nr:DUF58 domain-containing protein [candidate division Zixibacteria bacterium]
MLVESRTDHTKFLQPEVIAKLANMELRARFVVEGFLVGLHKSPYHGFSVEFAEYRQYNPGDPIKNIDWKAYGRTDRYYIKQFEEETNLRTYILLDASASMSFASEGQMPKFQYASYLAASFAYLMQLQKDAVGLTVFDDKIREERPPSSTRVNLFELLRLLERTSPEGKTSTANIFGEIAQRIRRRGLVVIISDLYDDPETMLGAIKQFRHRGHEVIVFHIVDPLEISFEFKGETVFTDLESGGKVQTQPWTIREEYQRKFSDFIDRVRMSCEDSRIDYELLDTTSTFDVALMAYLHKRGKLG